MCERDIRCTTLGSRLRLGSPAATKTPFDEAKILRDDKRGSLTAGSLAGQGRGCFAGVILPRAPETTITTKRLRFRDSG